MARLFVVRLKDVNPATGRPRVRPSVVHELPYGILLPVVYKEELDSRDGVRYVNPNIASVTRTVPCQQLTSDHVFRLGSLWLWVLPRDASLLDPETFARLVEIAGSVEKADDAARLLIEKLP